MQKSHIEDFTKQFVIDPIECSIHDLVDDIKIIFQDWAQVKGVKLSIHLSSNVPSKLVTNYTAFKLILGDIIDNAIKFTPMGNVRVHIFCEKKEAESLLHAFVLDNGIGMEKNVAARIFDPPSETNGKSLKKGSLWRSRQIAKAIGGHVQVLASRPYRGSHFHVSLAADIPY